MKGILRWILRPKCIVCNQECIEGSIFCSICFSKIVFIDYPICEVCGKLLKTDSGTEKTKCYHCEHFGREFDKARALFLYDHYTKKILMKLKSESDNYVARDAAKQLLFRYGYLFCDIDFIIPVPSHWIRIMKRGYNPATMISEELSKLSGIDMRRYLMRKKYTKYQRGKSYEERQYNVKDAFKTTGDVSGKNILLVDDVFTTGATLNECSKTLKESGAKRVTCLTVASTIGRM